MAIITYEGYALYSRDTGGYTSVINGESMLFDTASQWVQYINLIKRIS